MQVSELMTRDVVTCGSNDSLGWAAELMWKHDCGVVPVVDEGRVHAMLTDRDICMAAWSRGGRLSDLRVGDAASRALYSVREDEAIEVAEARMRAHQVRRLPVVDRDGRLLGILSLNDVARHLHLISSHLYEGLGSESVALTLAVISRPPPPLVPESQGEAQVPAN